MGKKKGWEKGVGFQNTKISPPIFHPFFVASLGYYIRDNTHLFFIICI